MMTKISSKKWIAYFSITTITIFLLMIVVVYVFDPFFQFRVKENNIYFISPYNSTGLVNNYNYDTLIIGSSMTQNFDMNLCRELLSCNPLHIAIQAISAPEIIELMHDAYSVKKADTFYICIDFYLFETENPSIKHFFQEDSLSKLRYMLSNEVWFHYLPLDIGIGLFRSMGISLPEVINTNTDIDTYGYWGDDFTYSEDIVIENYLSNNYSVSDVNLTGLYERMKKNIDGFFEELDFKNGKLNFFFPPYSSLFWCNAQNCGYYEDFLKAKKYFVQKANIYDFQSADFTMNLNNYKDTSHYSPRINDLMVESFAKGDYIITNGDCENSNKKLTENTTIFRKRYTYLFE